jgi:hypothetical protein
MAAYCASRTYSKPITDLVSLRVQDNYEHMKVLMALRHRWTNVHERGIDEFNKNSDNFWVDMAKRIQKRNINKFGVHEDWDGPEGLLVLVEFLKKRIENSEMFAFDDYDETKQSLDDYLGGLGEKDVEELWQANVNNIKDEVAASTPQEFFQSLPEELQYAAKYVADGGQDLKGLFQALAQVEAVREMDPTDDNDQEHIVRQYLQATNFGTSEEIDEELTTWKDLGTLEKKAKQFKPKLDQMQEQIVQSQLQEQEYRKQQQQNAADAYQKNVFEALRPAEINGLKLDKKVQAQLYTGLVQPQYASISGKPTNLLGHLLERYQFVEPNYPLIAEALWLLSNPDEYRGNLMKQGKTQAVEQTVRQLKTEQSRKNISTYQEEEQDRPKKISKPQNIFKR